MYNNLLKIRCFYKKPFYHKCCDWTTPLLTHLTNFKTNGFFSEGVTGNHLSTTNNCGYYRVLRWPSIKQLRSSWKFIQQRFLGDAEYKNCVFFYRNPLSQLPSRWASHTAQIQLKLCWMGFQGCRDRKWCSHGPVSRLSPLPNHCATAVATFAFEHRVATFRLQFNGLHLEMDS